MNRITDSFFFPIDNPAHSQILSKGSNQYRLKLRRIILLRYFEINTHDSVELKAGKVLYTPIPRVGFRNFSLLAVLMGHKVKTMFELNSGTACSNMGNVL
jgi:hypothetical protein